jgi:hypothetical protein
VFIVVVLSVVFATSATHSARAGGSPTPTPNSGAVSRTTEEIMNGETGRKPVERDDQHPSGRLDPSQRGNSPTALSWTVATHTRLTLMAITTAVSMIAVRLLTRR